ncbi:HD-GYP domain-containing protein [Undibacterium sp. Dicai25W]|uniref:HD-GYP domain-containing protein n=1 Tax=Undibacterium sp. Dicai25W TaxID=3413034 RepID=UPI003BF24161
MTDIHTKFIDLSRLRVGMFVYLDVGWMDHPFPVSNFKISSQEQIDTLRSLGLERIRYSPDKSVPPDKDINTETVADNAVDLSEKNKKSPEEQALRLRRDLLADQAVSLQVCERQFTNAAQTFKQIGEQAHAQPALARELSEQLIQNFLGQILGEDEAAIRLLSEKAGEKSSLHSINVTVMSLLLGKALDLSKADMHSLGVGALVHDLGKIDLPDRLRWSGEQFNYAENQIFNEHVSHGVNLARKMNLSANAMLLIAQHHEHFDGSGYPSRVKGEKMSPLSRIVALVNHYDNMCNPANPAQAITPHEALSQIFTQHKTHFHAPTLTAFIRMMGIYPPGSVVQLTDERYALVVSVNSARPIKPKVIIHDPTYPREEALIINLEQEQQLCIHRSLKPLQLPKAAYDYLSPRKRLCYFFERGLEVGADFSVEGSA